MNKPDAIPAPVVSPTEQSPARPFRPRGLALALVVVMGLFGPALYELLKFAAGSALYSYILLIPPVSLYLAWQARGPFSETDAPSRPLALALLASGLGALLVFTLGGSLSSSLAIEDRLAITTSAFLLAGAGTCAWFVGRRTLRTFLFPLCFLIFMVPMPTAFLGSVETFMQHGSAAVAKVLFETAGTVVFYENLTFQIPGIALHVAPECSGIRSTLVLLIVSVLTGYMFLRSPGKRALLAAAIVPLALARNGLRIFVIGELCVQYGPEMIDSMIHRRGGPVFFALSLVPLFLLLVILQRREQQSRR